MSDLKLISLNVRGKATKNKCNLFVQEFITHNPHIAYLCDTHLQIDTERYLKNQLPDYNIYSSYSPNGNNRGTSILIKKLESNFSDSCKSVVAIFGMLIPFKIVKFRLFL